MPKFQRERQTDRAAPYLSTVDASGMTGEYLRINNPYLQFPQPTKVSRAYKLINYVRTAKRAKKIWDEAKILMPSQTIKEAARLVAMPTARFVGKHTGFTQIETVTFYTMEGIAIYTDPVGYTADRVFQYLASQGAQKAIDYFEITNPELRDAIIIGASEATSALVDKAKDTERVKKLRNAAKKRLDESRIGEAVRKVDGVCTDAINKALNMAHIDPDIPLREQIKFNEEKNKNIVLELFEYDADWVIENKEKIFEALMKKVPEMSGSKANDIINILTMVENNTDEGRALKFISHLEGEKGFELVFSGIPGIQGNGHINFSSPDQIKINGSKNPLKDGYIIDKSGNSPYMSLVFTLYSRCRSLAETDDPEKKALLGRLINKEYTAVKTIVRWNKEYSKVRDDDADIEMVNIRIASQKLADEVLSELLHLKNNDTYLFHSSYPGHTMYHVFKKVNGRLQIKIYNGGNGADLHMDNDGNAHPVVFPDIASDGEGLQHYLESNFKVQLSRQLEKLDGESPEEFKQRTDQQKKEWLNILYDNDYHYLGWSYVDENSNTFPLQKDGVGNCTTHNLNIAEFDGILQLNTDCDVCVELTEEALDYAYELRSGSQKIKHYGYHPQNNEPEYTAKTTRSGGFFGPSWTQGGVDVAEQTEQTISMKMI